MLKTVVYGFPTFHTNFERPLKMTIGAVEHLSTLEKKQSWGEEGRKLLSFPRGATAMFCIPIKPWIKRDKRKYIVYYSTQTP